MTKVTHICNGCGTTRGEANHWFATNESSRHTILPTITIFAFVDARSDYEHFCGEGCLIKKVSSFLAEVKRSAEELALANEAGEHVPAAWLEVAR